MIWYDCGGRVEGKGRIASFAQVTEFGVQLPNTLIFDHPTVAAIAQFLASEVKKMRRAAEFGHQ